MRRYVIQENIHAPYFIFLRCAGKYSDEELLRRFALPSYEPTNTPPQYGPYAIFANDGPWTLIADDWYYTLWHMQSTRPTIAAMGTHCDVFACSVGECDNSYDFGYYHDSQLVRNYVVADPDFGGGSVVQNFGPPLPGEANAFKHTDAFKIVMVIATSLGIKTKYKEQDLRLYAPLE